MKITILFGGECPIPPEAIGAVEIRWFNVGSILASMGYDITLIGKGNASIPRDKRNFHCKTIPGFSPSRYRIVTIFRAFINCLKMVRLVKPCDILVVNNAWAMLLLRIFGRKHIRKIAINVARMPKGFFWARNKGADLFICPSSPVANRVKRLIPDRMASHVVVTPNPVDIRHFNNRLSPNSGNYSARTIVYHGRIHREKGLHLLAEAANDLKREYPDLRLKFIGAVDEAKGGSGSGYKNELDEIFEGDIEWIEPIADRGRLANEIASCGIYCYPSLAENGETFGVAPLEAMSLGLPVVVSRLECFQDFVDNGVSGLMFDHRSKHPVSELRDCLNRLLSNPALCKKISSTGAVAALNFSTEHVADHYARLFNAIVAAEGEKP